ncbi:Alpha/Beta hydrolase protein [Dendryphion nanum]|uniref:Alpha/Beta hydrolase protein n=1 Tax=Dendryphion nanum TaxID=256645 RepID=A0A9P9I738_9PLEO|nr:Alpha/Beta hydrolase protein [Dendryphion nanum]
MPYFKHSNVDLFYTAQGSGPPILLLHGYACSSHDWSFQIPYLVSLNFSVIALDQRGHGRSSAPAIIEAYDLRTFTADAVALLRYLEVGPSIIVGHSMGSVIASIIAVEHQDIVKGLVLVHPIYCGVPPALSIMGEAMKTDPEAAPELVAQFFEKVMYTARTPEWLKTWQLRRVLGVDPAALTGCIVGLIEVFDSVMGQSNEALEYMRRRKGPRLAICTNGLEAAIEWEREIGCEEGVDEIHGLTEGTFSHMVESERFNEILGDWLRRKSFASS